MSNRYSNQFFIGLPGPRPPTPLGECPEHDLNWEPPTVLPNYCPREQHPLLAESRPDALALGFLERRGKQTIDGWSVGDD